MTKTPTLTPTGDLLLRCLPPEPCDVDYFHGYIVGRPDIELTREECEAALGALEQNGLVTNGKNGWAITKLGLAALDAPKPELGGSPTAVVLELGPAVINSGAEG